MNVGSMKSIDDVIEYLTKQKELDKPMITNPNFNPEKLAESKIMDRQQRYENSKRRTLVDMRIRQNDPSYRETPDEEIVDISDGEE